jgi:Domain of unknown function (DUF4386)
MTFPKMVNAIRAGRIVGVIILVQMVGGFLTNFVLEKPLFGSPGFLVNAAPHSQQIALAALLALTLEALMVAIAVTTFPILRERTPALALWFAALAVVTLAVAVVENSGVMSMVSVSQAYASAGNAERQQLETIRVVVASARNWAHFLARIVDGAAFFVFYAALFRGALVPRALAGLGLVAMILQVTAVGMPLFGHEVIFLLFAPAGLSQLLLAVWLLSKGFRPRPTLDSVSTSG